MMDKYHGAKMTKEYKEYLEQLAKSEKRLVKVSGKSKKIKKILLLINSYLMAIGRIDEDEKYDIWNEGDIDEFVGELKKLV
jgi:collagenase-like PrtC family protease